jgi:hypothetical protein
MNNVIGCQKLKAMMETKSCIISHLGKLMGSMTQGLFGPNLVSIHPVILYKFIFKDFQFFNLPVAMAAILDVGQGHRI